MVARVSLASTPLEHSSLNLAEGVEQSDGLRQGGEGETTEDRPCYLPVAEAVPSIAHRYDALAVAVQAMSLMRPR